MLSMYSHISSAIIVFFPQTEHNLEVPRLWGSVWLGRMQVKMSSLMLLRIRQPLIATGVDMALKSLLDDLFWYLYLSNKLQFLNRCIEYFKWIEQCTIPVPMIKNLFNTCTLES